MQGVIATYETLEHFQQSPPNFKDFKFQKPLGEGAYGKVYMYEKDKQKYAVKIALNPNAGH